MIGTIRTVTIDILAADGTTVLASDVSASVGDGGFYVDEVSAAGGFSLDTHNDTTLAGYLSAGNHVRFKIGGTADRTCLIKKVNRTPVARKPADRVCTAAGLDWIAHLDDAPIYPPNGIGSKPVPRTIRFDWTHPSLSTTSWATPVSLGAMFSADEDQFGNPASAAVGAMWGIHPVGWPDSFGFWYWGEAVNGSGSHATQTDYFHVRPTLTAKPFVPVFTAKDTGQLAFDGAIIDSGVEAPTEQWTKCTASGVPEVSAGGHTLRMKVTHTFKGVNPDPGGVALAGYQANTSLEMMTWDNIVLRSCNDPGGTDFNLGGNWKVLHNPGSPPGFTVGHAFRLLFDATQTTDHLSGWTLGFTDVNDSNGNAWPVIDYLTANLDESLLEVATRWHDMSAWEFTARAGSKVIDGYRFEQRGNHWTSPGSPLVWDGDNVYQVDVEENL